MVPAAAPGAAAPQTAADVASATTTASRRGARCLEVPARRRIAFLKVISLDWWSSAVDCPAAADRENGIPTESDRAGCRAQAGDRASGMGLSWLRQFPAAGSVTMEAARDSHRPGS